MGYFGTRNLIDACRNCNNNRREGSCKGFPRRTSSSSARNLPRQRLKKIKLRILPPSNSPKTHFQFQINLIKFDDAMYSLNRTSRTPPAERAKSLNGNDHSLRVNIVTSPRALAFQHQPKSSMKLERSTRALKDTLTRIFSRFSHSRRRSPPIAITAVLVLLALWIFWSFLIPIRIYGFLPIPTGYPWGNLR